MHAATLALLLLASLAVSADWTHPGPPTLPAQPCRGMDGRWVETRRTTGSTRR